jgi:lysozyme family protein
MGDFNAAVKRSLGHEGVWSNHAFDPGGKTKYGVTEATLRWYQRTAGELTSRRIEDLTRDEAIRIFRRGWWRYDDLPDRIAQKVFDISINSEGPFPPSGFKSIAVRMLQQAINHVGHLGYLNSRNLREDLAVWVVPDGVLGPKTMAAVTEICSQEQPRHSLIKSGMGESMLYRSMCTHHLQRYINLIMSEPKRLVFLYGWAARGLD